MVEDKFEPKKLLPRELARLTPREKARYYRTRWAYLATRAWNDLHLSLATYFLVSAILYLACGTMVLILGQGPVEKFLCNVDCDTVCADRSEVLMCPKDTCYQAAVNLTFLESASSASDALYADMVEASTDLQCNDFITAATDPLDMMVRLYNAGLLGASPCSNFHCGVLKTAYTHPDLYTLSGVCTNVEQQKPLAEAETCVCSVVADVSTPALSATSTIGGTVGDEIYSTCGLIEVTNAPTASTDTPTTAPTTSATLPSQRRLFASVFGQQAPSSFPTMVPAAVRPEAEDEQEAASREIEVQSSGVAGDAIDAANADAGEVIDRRLQNPTPAPNPPTEFPTNYDMTAWGSCTGLQQCVPGVQSRVVKCADGPGACAPPVPASDQACIVDHCSNCTVLFSLQLVSFSYYIQGGVALMVWAVFAAFNSRTEEQRDDMMVHPHICMRPLGFICKTLPPLVRILVLVNFGQLALLLVQTWVPTSILDYCPDCNDSWWLRFVTVTASSIWTFQFFFGLVARAYCRQEPWLYSPIRSGCLKPLWQISSYLGP